MTIVVAVIAAVVIFDTIMLFACLKAASDADDKAGQ